ncbi:hypothetical protein FSARC_1341 [Fusarium sarcochroum]|uniref:DUF7726 domain-containing protein n=1 Tax=Fusarium sarcochroum TaxID=1208366 RepID=A0A8H4U955_9HYPO|nr:hypothetical protein FSARC_1341 [Fusarium sarcochroum]
MPDVKRRQFQEQQKDAADGSPSTASGSASKVPKFLPDISDIHLDGEETDEVPVFDSCDEVRRKITVHMKTPASCTKCKGIQSKQPTDFRGLQGANTGAKGTVFYAAYVYFEKLRIAQGKPKTKHREDMEDIHPGGFSREQNHNTSYLVVGSSGNLGIDRYGLTVSY